MDVKSLDQGVKHSLESIIPSIKDGHDANVSLNWLCPQIFDVSLTFIIHSNVLNYFTVSDKFF